jgi:DNA-directed RNA polymerase specialized sigma24 family protein
LDVNTDDEGDTSNRYSPDEIKTALAGLSQADMGRLIEMSEVLAKRCRLSGDDLLNEAFCRALEGRRRCGRGTSIVGFLWGVMRSLASEEIEAIKTDRRPVLVSEFAKDGDRDAGQDVLTVNLTPGDGAMVSRIHDKAVLEKIEALVSGDEQLAMLVEGLKENLRGEALQELLGVDVKGLAALRKRLKRSLTSIDPERIAS